MDLIAEGIKQKLIRFEDDEKYVIYVHQNKRRNYANPEEKVQVDAFLRLVLTYGYPVKRIRQFVPVRMGVETKEADIIVYSDDGLTEPLIVAECKHPDVSELEFARSAGQAVSYAVAEGARLSGQPASSRMNTLRSQLRSQRLGSQFRTFLSAALPRLPGSSLPRMGGRPRPVKSFFR